MDVNVVVSLDEKEVRDAIATAAKAKLGKEAQGSYKVVVCPEGVDITGARVEFQYKKN